MPITLTFDIDEASVDDGNDRARIAFCFQRLGWEHIGGSAWRYPALGADGHPSEDWFNHVIPALMYFRSIVEHAHLRVTKFAIDAHSEAGYRAGEPPIGAAVEDAGNIQMYPLQQVAENILSEPRLRQFIREAAASL